MLVSVAELSNIFFVLAVSICFCGVFLFIIRYLYIEYCVSSVYTGGMTRLGIINLRNTYLRWKHRSGNFLMISNCVCNFSFVKCHPGWPSIQYQRLNPLFSSTSLILCLQNWATLWNNSWYAFMIHVAMCFECITLAISVYVSEDILKATFLRMCHSSDKPTISCIVSFLSYMCIYVKRSVWSL